MTFDEACSRLIAHEGGYVDHPSDPGGATNFGISQRAYPHENIAGMTVDRAQALYRRDVWGPAGCDAVPDAIKFDLFDMAAHSGVRAAIKCLQGAVAETRDGVLGPRTLQAAHSMPSTRLVARFNGARLEFMASLPTWPAFGRGWSRRIAANLQAV